MIGPRSDKNRWRRTLQTNLIWRGYLASNYVLPQRRTLYCLTPTICTAEQSYHFTSNVIANLVRSIKYHLCSHIYKRLQFEKEKEGEEEWAGGGGRGPVEKFNWNAFLVSKCAVYVDAKNKELHWLNECSLHHFLDAEFFSAFDKVCQRNRVHKNPFTNQQFELKLKIEDTLHYATRAAIWITKCSPLKFDFSANFHLIHNFFWRLSQHPKNWKTQKGIYKYQFKGV